MASNGMPDERKYGIQVSKTDQMKAMKKAKLKAIRQNILKREKKEAKENYNTMKWRMTWKMKCPMIN